MMPASLMISGLVPNTIGHRARRAMVGLSSRCVRLGSRLRRRLVQLRSPSALALPSRCFKSSIQGRVEVEEFLEIALALERERAKTQELKRDHQRDAANHEAVGSGLVRRTGWRLVILAVKLPPSCCRKLSDDPVADPGQRVEGAAEHDEARTDEEHHGPEHESGEQVAVGAVRKR